jgi:hypothetical protein
MLCVPFVSSSYNVASAQERETCSQARSAVRDLHANWLLDCRASEKVRIPAAMMEKRASRLERAHAGMYAHDSMRKVTRTE